MKCRSTAGFTLIELLVVIAIIAILAAILFPVFARAKDSATTTACISNMKQIYRATMMYTNDYDGDFPVMMGNWTWQDEGIRNRYRHRYMDAILGPYTGDKDVFICPAFRRNEGRYDKGGPYGGPWMFSPWWAIGENTAFGDATSENPRVRAPHNMLRPTEYNLYTCGSMNNHGRVHDRQLDMVDLYGTVVCKGDGQAMMLPYHKDQVGFVYWDGGVPQGQAFVDR